MSGCRRVFTFFIAIVLSAGELQIAEAGKAASDIDVKASYVPGAKAVNVFMNGIAVSEPLRGYQATDLTVDSLSDNKKFVAFVDEQGLSVGGDLRVFVPRDGHLSEIGNEFFGNKISVETLAGTRYIALWQHDTKEMYYVSNLLIIKDGQLQSSKDSNPWVALIHEKYATKISDSADNFTRSRYDYYIGKIYFALSDRVLAGKYLEDAEKLDPGNQQIRRAIDQLSLGDKH